MRTLSLPSVLDPAAAAPLRSLLLAHRGEDLELEASSVTRIGGQCLQVLLSAQRTWRTDGKQFRLRAVSGACRDALAITGAAGLVEAEA